jgi:hypothetical protein
MLKSGLIASVCALGLLAVPVMAAGTAATSPAATSGKPGTTHHKATHVSTGATHVTRSAGSSSRASAHDNMADRLNGQSLQAAMQGHPFGAGGTGMVGGTAVAPQPGPASRP